MMDLLIGIGIGFVWALILVAIARTLRDGRRRLELDYPYETVNLPLKSAEKLSQKANF